MSEDNDDNIFYGKTCIHLMTAGILGSDRQHPKCLGWGCVDYHSCWRDALLASHDIDELLLLAEKSRMSIWQKIIAMIPPLRSG